MDLEILLGIKVELALLTLDIRSMESHCNLINSQIMSIEGNDFSFNIILFQLSSSGN